MWESPDSQFIRRNLLYPTPNLSSRLFNSVIWYVLPLVKTQPPRCGFWPSLFDQEDDYVNPFQEDVSSNSASMRGGDAGLKCLSGSGRAGINPGAPGKSRVTPPEGGAACPSDTAVLHGVRQPGVQD